MRRERLLRETEALELLEIVAGECRAVAGHGLARERTIAQVLDLVDDLSDGTGVNTENRFQGSETPRHLMEVGIHLDANRPGRIHLRVAYAVGHCDVAQSGRLADLIVEGDEGKAETEHQHDHDA